jgi:hypothetical protein
MIVLAYQLNETPFMLKFREPSLTIPTVRSTIGFRTILRRGDGCPGLPR